MAINSLADLDRLASNKGKQNVINDTSPEVIGNIKNFLGQISPKMNPGINMATGMMSMAYPGKQGEMVQNLPQVMRGTERTMPEYISQELGKFIPGIESGGAATPATIEKGAQIIKKGGKQIGKGWDYLHPEKAAEEFRSTLGEGTSKENVARIGEKIKSAKESAKKEALQPKKELMKEHAETVIEPGAYRNAENVNNTYGLGLNKYHNEYINEPTIENADTLLSKISKEIRKLEGREKKAGLDSTADVKLEQLRSNKENLLDEFENKISQLPEKFQNLYQEFRTKYAKNVGPYEDAGEGARSIVRKLAKGKAEEVSPAQVGRIFTRPTDQVKKILTDIGPNAGKNILYLALQKVQPGDAGKLAETIIDLKRTKGYDHFIDDNMMKWAENMQKQVGRSDMIKKALVSGASGLGAGYLIGPTAGLIAGALPYAGKGVKKALDLAKRGKK